MIKYVLLIGLTFFSVQIWAQEVRVVVEVQSRLPLGKIQSLKESLQVQFPGVSGLLEREIRYGSYSFEGKTKASLETLKKPAETFLFESLPVKSVVIEDNRIIIKM